MPFSTVSMSPRSTLHIVRQSPSPHPVTGQLFSLPLKMVTLPSLSVIMCSFPKREMWNIGTTVHLLSTWASEIFLIVAIQGLCKGTLLPTHFCDGISPPHNSGHIPSMQCPVCPTTSPVNCLLLNPTPSISLPLNPLTETWKCTLKISTPYSIVYHCCPCHHCCVTTIVLLSIVPSCI